MAVSKIWPIRYSLKRVLDYAANPDKTEKKDYSDEQYQALAESSIRRSPTFSLTRRTKKKPSENFMWRVSTATPPRQENNS